MAFGFQQPPTSSGDKNFWAKQGPQGDRATEPLSPLVVLFCCFFPCVAVCYRDVLSIIWFGSGFFCRASLPVCRLRPPGPLHSDSGVKILSLILALGGLQWARGSGRLFLVYVLSGLLPPLSSLCCCSCCSSVVVGPVSGVARFFVTLFWFCRVAVCFVFVCSVVGVRGGPFLFTVICLNECVPRRQAPRSMH